SQKSEVATGRRKSRVVSRNRPRFGTFGTATVPTVPNVGTFRDSRVPAVPRFGTFRDSNVAVVPRFIVFRLFRDSEQSEIELFRDSKFFACKFPNTTDFRFDSIPNS